MFILDLKATAAVFPPLLYRVDIDAKTILSFFLPNEAPKIRVERTVPSEMKFK